MGVVVDLRDYGAVGDGLADDSAAWFAMLASGVGDVHVADGVYRILSPTPVTASYRRIVGSPRAVLQVGSPLNIGSETESTVALDIRVHLRADPTWVSAGPLVRCINLGNSELDLAFVPTASWTGDLCWVHSCNGFGNYDNLYHLYNPTPYTVDGTCLTLCNGSGNTPSVAGDFVNGNTFMRCNLAAFGSNGRCVALRPTAQWFPASVSGVIARNLFKRCDWNSYNINGGGLGVLNAGNVSFLEFQECTFEGTAPNYDIDISLSSSPGCFFRHPRASHPESSQQGLEHSLWVNDESTVSNVD